MSIDHKVSHSIEHNTEVILEAMRISRAIQGTVIYTLSDTLRAEVAKWAGDRWDHSYNAIRTFVRHDRTNYDLVRAHLGIVGMSVPPYKDAINNKIDAALKQWHIEQTHKGNIGLTWIKGRPR